MNRTFALVWFLVSASLTMWALLSIAGIRDVYGFQMLLKHPEAFMAMGLSAYVCFRFAFLSEPAPMTGFEQTCVIASVALVTIAGAMGYMAYSGSQITEAKRQSALQVTQ